MSSCLVVFVVLSGLCFYHVFHGIQIVIWIVCGSWRIATESSMTSLDAQFQKVLHFQILLHTGTNSTYKLHVQAEFLKAEPTFAFQNGTSCACTSIISLLPQSKHLLLRSLSKAGPIQKGKKTIYPKAEKSYRGDRSFAGQEKFGHFIVIV